MIDLVDKVISNTDHTIRLAYIDLISFVQTCTYRLFRALGERSRLSKAVQRQFKRAVFGPYQIKSYHRTETTICKAAIALFSTVSEVLSVINYWIMSLNLGQHVCASLSTDKADYVLETLTGHGRPTIFMVFVRLED